ncbi:DUF6193 family natural product biosynthesis protein [Streptomyces sp. NPDC058572]|uniref:DUF6193 family natural product biosynthesis protein n=1 Tax=Streptomyces sp. NPDC058572 TaxID=3346546 RepID=UPI0036616972
MTTAADIVAAEWRYYFEDAEGLVDAATVRAAYAQPRLRELYPAVSHGIMFFSRCTGLPAARVGGQVYYLEDGRFRVRGPGSTGTLGVVDTLEEAFALVVDSLPEDCGPAIEGTARDL